MSEILESPFFNDTATTEIYTLSLHDALPIFWVVQILSSIPPLTQDDYICEAIRRPGLNYNRSEEHTSELQSRQYLVCRLLLEKNYQEFPGPPDASRCDLATGTEEFNSVFQGG